MRLILASTSPRRAELLRAAGLEFEVFGVDVDERALEGEAPEACVCRLAAAKSAAATALLHDERAAVLAADTLVTIDGAILGKPRDDDDARRMLARLSGRAHDVATGVSLRCSGADWSRVERSRVWFAPMSTEEIDWYVQTGEGRDKAGAYAIQGLGSRFVERIEGSYANVVGLPVSLVYRLIRDLHKG